MRYCKSLFSRPCLWKGLLQQWWIEAEVKVFALVLHLKAPATYSLIHWKRKASKIKQKWTFGLPAGPELQFFH